ncbi:MAG TPA: hypothetical protein VGI87_13840 [Solirubrobacteraceae bacterium]|jgi:hypothetical protein
MRRSLIAIGALVCVLTVSAGALAVPKPLSRGSVRGKVVYLGQWSVTVQKNGRMVGVINALQRSAGALGARDLPYVWGGGHGQAAVASIGERGGPGYNGRRRGFDCSGAVAAVLAGAGLWAPGSPVPNDAGVISQLLADHLIVKGAGRAPNEVTLYDWPGVHIFMNINGRFFGTSDGGGGGNRRGGPGWLDDGAPDASSRHFKAYHFVPSVLRNRTSYGQNYTFEIAADPALTYGAELGDVITVGYSQARNGITSAQSVLYRGAVTTSGMVTATAEDGSSVTIQTPAGQTVTLATTLVPDLIDSLLVGDTISVTYAKDPSGLLVPHALTVLSTPAPPTTTTPPPPTPTPPLPGPEPMAAG